MEKYQIMKKNKRLSDNEGLDIFAYTYFQEQKRGSDIIQLDFWRLPFYIFSRFKRRRLDKPIYPTLNSSALPQTSVG